MQDPWTWTTVWGPPEGVVVLGRGGQMGKMWDNCNNINNEIQLEINSKKKKEVCLNLDFFLNHYRVDTRHQGHKHIITSQSFHPFLFITIIIVIIWCACIW